MRMTRLKSSLGWGMLALPLAGVVAWGQTAPASPSAPASPTRGTTPALQGTGLPGTGANGLPMGKPGAAARTGAGGAAAAGRQGAGVAVAGTPVTVDQALNSAQANEPVFAAAVAAAQVAALERKIARSALLPQVVFHNQFIYTQPAHVQDRTVNSIVGSSPRFVANNSVHEYVSQGLATETIGLAQYTAFSRAAAEAAIANAELEIARRGLTSAVLGLFYAASTAERRIATEQRAVDEAQSFVTQTGQREVAREAAHADVIKAELTLQGRQRDLENARLEASKARLDLGVLLFPDPRTAYTLQLPAVVDLPSQAAFEAAANTNNPELQSALATLHSRELGVTAARAAYLPDLALNYSYGIDAPQFAVTSPDGVRNLGYSAAATVDIPIFDWFATQNRVKQSRILRDAAKVTLSSAQRTLIAQLEEFYAEATLAHTQLESLQVSVQTAGESLRLTRLRYTAGEATVLEVVDAQASLTTAELALTDGTVRYQVALANLQLLTGTF